MTEALAQRTDAAESKPDLAAWAPIGMGLAVGAFILSIFRTGWLPHDDGYLAWAARETLNGAIPHLDFHEVYTGGLSYLNAWAFKALGESMLTLRIPYLVLFAAFGVVLYLVARRFLTRTHSALAVGSVILLGPALTATPMPTLYNLFLGTFALYFAFRFSETGRYAWLLSAGLVTGLSVLVKITGLYFVLAIPLGLIAHHSSRRESGPDAVSRALLVLAAIVPTWLIAGDFTISRFVGLLVPLYMVVWCIWNLKAPEPTEPRASDGLVSIIIFGMGVALPLGLYGFFYWANDAVDELLRGITGSASAVIGELGFDLADLKTLGIPLGLVGVIFLTARLSRGRNAATAIGMIGGFVLVWYALAPRSELLTIHGATRWISLVGCAGLLLAALSPDGGLRLDPRLHMLGATVACFQLVQFPSSNQWQVAYTVPLAGILLIALLARLERRLFLESLTVVVAFAVVFGLARHQGQVFASSETGVQVPFVPLESEYGGIQIPVVQEYYNDVVAEITARSESELLMAGPDDPEVYFLTGKRGSYPGVFPVLDEPIDPEYTMSRELERNLPDMVVVDLDPPVSDLEEPWLTTVRRNCDLSLVAGPFEVYVDCGRP